MSQKLPRRNFIKKSLTVSAALPIAASLEESTLLASGKEVAAKPVEFGSAASLPSGQIGKVKISRLICGGNLISGYGHSRDLIYVSPLLKHYFTDQRIMDTWALCEEHGINTMIAYSGDPHALEVYQNYKKRGGKIQFLAQIAPKTTDLKAAVNQAIDFGAVGAFLVGNLGDAWTRSQKVDLVGKVVDLVKEQGLIAGVAGHELRTPQTVEEAGIKPDFYVKTLHSDNYWSKRQPDQQSEVIDNYGVDNYWCRDAEGTIRFMLGVERPWIAYKVLAAGAVHPRSGFKYAFEKGADFAAVGMFDFQIAEDVAVANQVLSETQNRDREWWA